MDALRAWGAAWLLGGNRITYILGLLGLRDGVSITYGGVWLEGES